jgi:hypothetical protein
MAVLMLGAIGVPVEGDEARSLGPHIASCRIGFDGTYKVGHWTPAHVTLSSQPMLDGQNYAIEVETVDSDGVTTVYTSSRLLDRNAGSVNTVYVKFGRPNSPCRIRLLKDDKVIDERVVRPGEKTEGELTINVLPATAELLVTLAPAPFGFREAISDRAASTGLHARRVVELATIADLPDRWIGYEAIDVLVLSIGDGSLWRELARDERRLSALREWIELGGKLVILFGGRAGPGLVDGEVSLALIAPGKFDGERSLGRLPDTSAIKHYAQSDVEIVRTGERSQLGIVQLADPEGHVELYARGPAHSPLVVRAPRGLGGVTFIGLDLDVPPLSTWSGRNGLLRAVMKPLVGGDEAVGVSRNLMTTGYEDLSGTLRQQLAESFSGVRPTSFSAVVGLSLFYVFVLGPVQLLLVRGWFKKSWAAWVSFPLVLFLFAAGAVALANARDTGGGSRVNSAEIVDIDVSSGQARGTYWATLYSPSAKRYDVTFATNYSTMPSDGLDAFLSWNGLAGSGIGGMRSAGPDFGQLPAGYRQPIPRKLEGVPLLSAGTKSFIARWSSPAGPSIDAELRDDNTMLAGKIVNQTGLPLKNARLLYGSWAYRLKDIEPSGVRTFDSETVPISVKTLLTGLALGAPVGALLRSERNVLATEQASVDELLNVMMFYEAAGGAGFAGLPLRYQAECDLSRQLELGRAVLIAEVEDPTSHLDVAGVPGAEIVASESNSRTIYRFVLPVQPN